ncbi:adenosylcobinamide-GDP ribazoletransferase [Halofilum ochraceum]|uniref:adenosylcobinamide-GDP ribazoletransferase n=1 Tax=Halofilum ochraceum TaxID=1611323 RepID=UPI00082C0701|nr:adenosylcobinamide-GDP ribazoletransferase [Halofilum ochraceum]
MSERLPAWAHDAATAVIFLTRLPVPWTVPDVADRIHRCTPWFPAVGVLVGGIGALAWWLAALVWPPVIAAIVAVAVTALATGAFHEDGLADTFDGLGGSPDRERALDIMKDSRVGTYGVTALVLVLAGRVAALTALGGAAPAALIGAHSLARCSSLPPIRWLNYARREGGTGKPFAGGITLNGLIAALAATALLTVVLFGNVAVVTWIAGAVGAGLIVAWSRARLDGITGDTLGAANQIAELAVYLALLAALG